MKTISVIGAGSWGTALALLLSKHGVPITIWGFDPVDVDSINKHRVNERFLPGAVLPANIEATTRLEDCGGAELTIMVSPSAFMRSVCEQMRATGVGEQTVFISCCKGIELHTNKRMSEIIQESFPDHHVAVLSGPTHAEEVAKETPTAAVIGSTDDATGLRLQKVFTLPWFRTYTSNDPAGIELGGALKNIYALAAGIAEGLGLGDNARAALVTRGLAELIRLGVALGGKAETFQGLSGIGDLIVTCFSHHSRNNTVGRMLGSGRTLDEIMKEMTMIAEGVPNTRSAHQAAHALDVRTPIIDEIHAILYEDKPAREALQELLSRDPRPEAD